VSRDSIGWYLTQIGRYPLLTPSQEISLAKQVQAGKEPAAARARRKLFLCNLRFVVNVAKRYARGVKSLQLEDLIQHGNLGLHKAVDRFDPERGYKFSTYSRHWIVQAILSGISEEEHAIRLPRDKRADVYRVRRAAGKLIQQLGRTPTMEEVAKVAEVPVTTCELAAGISNHPTSLDVELPGSGTLMDLIESPGGTDDDEEDREWPVRLVPTLPERERMVVERYYGLMGYPQTPMTQIAADMGVSRTMISLIRDRALNRLRMNYARMLSA
jgi:RNA polymerase sigma factor (sigma-70 family)